MITPGAVPALSLTFYTSTIDTRHCHPLSPRHALVATQSTCYWSLKVPLLRVLYQFPSSRPWNYISSSEILLFSLHPQLSSVISDLQLQVCSLKSSSPTNLATQSVQTVESPHTLYVIMSFPLEMYLNYPLKFFSHIHAPPPHIYLRAQRVRSWIRHSLAYLGGREEEEILFSDLRHESMREAAGLGKGLQNALRTCKRAREDSLEWVWIDTCCIDK
ncbi:hypothetical protein D9758_006430 [Tetrapyrgos nigripes]|uniref:Heterokaryon incompatibility domain-containing protein n=1 Tax=Tetrapyrgos nigripes TaxID=182062 RepID=A0A8H5D8A5_9AGAR|nr:hypothetical protein D9758_006430 [Tetrapyrgos nigripes]